METLNEVSIEFPETKQFIEEHLKQICLKEKILVEEVIYFFDRPVSKEPAIKKFESKNVFS